MKLKANLYIKKAYFSLFLHLFFSVAVVYFLFSGFIKKSENDVILVFFCQKKKVQSHVDC